MSKRRATEVSPLKGLGTVGAVSAPNPFQWVYLASPQFYSRAGECERQIRLLHSQPVATVGCPIVYYLFKSKMLG